MNNTFIEPTGASLTTQNQNIINCKVGEFIVSVKVNENNQFIGIQDISVDKIFYDHTSVKGDIDVSMYYEDKID